MGRVDLELPYYSLPGGGDIHPLTQDSYEHMDTDPRGLIKLWEPPRPNAFYVMGVDASAGLLNWSRSSRTDDDLKTDNSVVVVIRRGLEGVPDVQVAEYAAPIDAEELADVVALLGRLYCGASEYNEALCIIETWPGPGLLTQRRLINEFGYTNLFRWEYLDQVVTKATNAYGWQSNTKTLQLLWSRFSRHLAKGLIKINSEWLFEELSDLQNIPGKTFPQPSGELGHDDRVRAVAMAVWAAHDWSMQEIPQPKKIEAPTRDLNPQACDMSYDAYEDWAEEKYQEMLNG